MEGKGMRSMWEKVRVLILAALLMPSAYLVGNNLGYREGIARQIGGPGQFAIARVERPIPWDLTKVVVYLNDGANGYSFWMSLRPKFVHYTAAAKVFTCDNTNRQSIRECMESSRAWARDDWEGHDSRIVGGELKPRADDGDSAEADKDSEFSLDTALRQSEREELALLRRDVNEMALTIDSLRRQLAQKGVATK